MPNENLPDRQSIISNRLRRGYVGFNGSASVIELLAGTVTGNMAQAVDGLHGSAEIAITNTQMKDAHRLDHIGDTRRRYIYSAITAFSLSGAGVASGDLLNLWHYGSDLAVLESIGLGATAISLGSCAVTANVLINRIREKYGRFGRSWRQKVVTPTETDVIKHIVFKDTPSATLALISGGARIASEFGYYKTGHNWLKDVENTLGVISGGWGVYLFRPTRRNLFHQEQGASHETLSKPMEELIDLRQSSPTEKDI